MENTASSSGVVRLFLCRLDIPHMQPHRSLVPAIWRETLRGIFYLAAPGALGKHVPPRRWIDIGISVAVLIFAALALGYFFDALALY